MLAVSPTPAHGAESLFVDFRYRIYGYIRRRVRDLTDSIDVAEELTSKVFCKATCAMLNSNGPTQHETGWIFRIAHNAIIDHYRDLDRHPAVSLEHFAHFPSPDDDPEIDLDRIVASTSIARAMQCLTDAQRQVIQMRFFEGYSFEEIAVAMNSNEGAVKALQHRAIASMRQVLNKEDFA